MTSLKTALTCAVLLTPLAAAAQPAQRNCAPRATVLETLAAKYSESRRSAGLAANNHMVEVFASTTTGSWTITATAPTGITCLIASGQGFETLNDPLPNDDPDA